MEVVCESDLSIARDNPATSALLALLQAVLHLPDRAVYAGHHPLAVVQHLADDAADLGG